MNNLAREDLNVGGGGTGPAAKAKAGAGSGRRQEAGGDAPVASGAGGPADAGGGPVTPGVRAESKELIDQVRKEVRRLAEEANVTQERLQQLDRALEALRAGTPAASVQAALGPPIVGDGGAGAAAAGEAAKISEAAARAAQLSADECQRLKEELAEIVNAVNIPSVGLEEDSIFDEAKPVDGEDVDLDDEVRDDAARQYVERQTQMESRLKQLEEQLDSASVVMPESHIFGSLKAVIKDVRRCLSRCELLYQLPEIKMFVKRFQRSLEVNAILHEKWIGPGAGKRQLPDDELENRPRSALGSHRSEDQMTRDSEISRSAPDLRARGRGGGSSGKKQEGVKKKPFRTVVDWCRPHTPLKIDPMFKGHSPPTGGGGSRGGAEDRPPPHLPQIK